MKGNNGLTRRNPDGRTYRIPLLNGAEFEMHTEKEVAYITGKIADRLGQYERLGLEPCELKKCINTKVRIKLEDIREVPEKERHSFTKLEENAYIIPLLNGVNFRLDSTSMIPCVFGAIANRLGEFEMLQKEPEELEELISDIAWN